MNEFKSFYKSASGGEGERCKYPVRLDTYGCGCAHNCSYCYARGLLEFRGMWHPEEPSVADIGKIRRKLGKVEEGTVLRLGGMTGCMQPAEMKYKVTKQTIAELNKRGIGYLIVTKSPSISSREYLSELDPELAHVQISVTGTSDGTSALGEAAPPNNDRIEAVRKLQDNGIDAAIRVSPYVPEMVDVSKLNRAGIRKCVVEFLRVNGHIRKALKGVDLSKYKLKSGGYRHMELEDKANLLKRFRFDELSVCEDVDEHFRYWQKHVNADKDDCCNLRKSGEKG